MSQTVRCPRCGHAAPWTPQPGPILVLCIFRKCRTRFVVRPLGTPAGRQVRRHLCKACLSTGYVWDLDVECPCPSCHGAGERLTV